MKSMLTVDTFLSTVMADEDILSVGQFEIKMIEKTAMKEIYDKKQKQRIIGLTMGQETNEVNTKLQLAAIQFAKRTKRACS